MPKGMPNAQTKAREKYQKKAGYVTKSFKLKKDVVDRFMAACEISGSGQAATITKLMNQFADDHEK